MIKSYIYQKNGLDEFDIKKFKSASSLKKNKQRLWVLAKKPSKEEIGLLSEKFSIHPTTLEDISGSNTRIKYEEFDSYTFIVFRGIKSLKNNKVSLYPIYIIDGVNFIITIIYDDNDTVEQLWDNKKKTESLL